MSVATMSKTQSEITAIMNSIEKMETATSRQIANDTGLGRNRVKSLLHDYILKNHSDKVVSKPRHGYVWVGGISDGTIKDLLDTMRKNSFKENKNSEGYSDPTAAAAIKNLDAESTSEDLIYNPGEIWKYDKADYKIDGGTLSRALIISATKSCAVLLDLKPMDRRYNPINDVAIDYKGKDYYMSCNKLYTKNVHLLRCLDHTLSGEQFDQIKTKIGKLLDIPQSRPKVIKQVVEKPVEKIVEKEVKVEVPVEKKVTDVDTLNSLMETRRLLELAEQRAEIWERAYYMLATGKEKEL